MGRSEKGRLFAYQWLSQPRVFFTRETIPRSFGAVINRTRARQDRTVSHTDSYVVVGRRIRFVGDDIVSDRWYGF